MKTASERIIEEIEDVKALSKEDSAKQTKAITGIKEKIKAAEETGESQERELSRLWQLYEELNHDVKKAFADSYVPGQNNQDSPGGRFIKAFRDRDGVQEMMGPNRKVAASVEHFFPHDFEAKTTITSGTVGSSTPGILTPSRVPGIIEKPRRRLTIRDVQPSKTTDRNVVEFVQENVFTNAASPQVEASAKAESALTFTIGSEAVQTIAHWIPASIQVLDDLPELRRFIDQTMTYGLKLKEETELLVGDNLGNHLNGLVTQASAYVGTYDVASDTQLDKLRHAILEAAAVDESVDFIVLNPVDAHNIALLKTEDSGTANTGAYIVGDPLGGSLRVSTLWGKSVVETNSIASGTFLVGSSLRAEIHDRMVATVALSTEHDDYFTRNLVAIRVEERIALAVYRTSAFITGQF